MCLHRFKLRSVFLIGFGIGFLFAIFLFTHQHLFCNISYQKSALNLYSTSKNTLFKWFISDTWINKEIIFQNWNKSTYSHAILLWGQPYNVANAGYVISMGVLKKLINMFDNSKKCIISGKYWKQEDYYLARHLASIGIYPSDTRDQYQRGTFHGYSLQSLLWGVVKTSAYWTHALYPIKNECCSFMSVTFNIEESEKMYTFSYLLHNFYVLKKKAVFGNRKVTTSISDEDVWKVALKEEFNITHLSNISSEMYYEIWHSKYSEPEQLIKNNYQTKDSESK